MAEARSWSPHLGRGSRDANGVWREASRSLRSMRVLESAGKTLESGAAGMSQKFETRPRRGANSSGGVSFREYLWQRPQRGGELLCRDYSQFLRQPGLVHGANLIDQDQTLPATMIDTDPKRNLATRRGHRGDEYCAQMIVQFGRGHHDARACLPDFAPDGGIKIHQPNLPTRHQTNSESPALPNSPITSSSPPVSAILLAASAQPVRTGLAGLRSTSAPSSIVISTPAFASRPSCAS